jgi:recombinational DNA repair protein RecR
MTGSKDLAGQTLQNLISHIPEAIRELDDFKDCRIEWRGQNTILIVTPDLLAGKIDVEENHTNYFILEGQSSPLVNETVDEITREEAKRKYRTQESKAYCQIGLFRSTVQRLLRQLPTQRE